MAGQGGFLENINKKFLLIAGGAFVLFVIAIILVVTLSSKGKKTPTVSPGTTLTFWNLTDEKSAFDQVINDFSDAHNIKIEYSKKEPAEYLNEALNEIAAGRGPDILAVPNDWLPKYHDKLVAMPDGKIANKKAKKTDLDVYKETFPAVAAQDNIIADKIFGMPLSIDTLGLYYNSDILSEAWTAYRRAHQDEDTSALSRIFSEGPKNWDEFSRAVKIITLSAAALGTADNIDESVDILTLMMLQNGAQMVSDDLSTAQFHTENHQFGDIAYPGTKALEFYASFANPKSENYTWNNSLPEAVRAFAEGKTAMLIDYQSKEADIKRINPKLSFSRINVPQIRETQNPVNYASYLTYTVTRAAKNPDLAWDFIIQMTDKNYANQYRSLTRKPTALLANIDASDPIYTAKSWYKPDPDKADEAFKEMIKQVNSGKNAQTAIEGCASQITTLLGKLKQWESNQKSEIQNQKAELFLF